MGALKSERLDQLTFSRCIAALTVVFFHFGQGVWPIGAPSLAPILQAGPTAVTYFYVLSGFLMAMVYFDLSRQDAAEYWLARFARIYPVYLLGLAACIWLNSAPVDLDLFLNVMLLQAWFPGHALSLNMVGWSLSVEVLFYAMFPILIGFARRISATRWCFSVAVIWVSTQLWTSFFCGRFYAGFPSRSHDLLFYFPPVHLASFLVGMTAGVLIRRGVIGFGRKAAWTATVSALAVVMAGLYCRAYVHSWTNLYLFSETGLLSPASALLIAGVYFLHAPAVAAGPLRLLGQASYAVYILQIPAFALLQRTLPDLGKPAFFWTYAAALVIASCLVFVLIETPSRRLIRSAEGLMRSVAPLQRGSGAPAAVPTRVS